LGAKNELDSLDIMVINHGMSYGIIKRNSRKYKKEDKLIFCYAGSLNSYKGIHLLIDAFEKIKSSNVILKYLAQDRILYISINFLKKPRMTKG
jgi:glycosyltransferase involved in cell wall biosynthesis